MIIFLFFDSGDFIANLFIVNENIFSYNGETQNQKQKESKTTTFFFSKLCYKELCKTCLRHVTEGTVFMCILYCIQNALFNVRLVFVKR